MYLTKATSAMKSKQNGKFYYFSRARMRAVLFLRYTRGEYLEGNTLISIFSHSCRNIQTTPPEICLPTKETDQLSLTTIAQNYLDEYFYDTNKAVKDTRRARQMNKSNHFDCGLSAVKWIRFYYIFPSKCSLSFESHQ